MTEKEIKRLKYEILMERVGNLFIFIGAVGLVIVLICKWFKL